MNLEETDDKNELDNELWFSFGNKISNNTIIVKAIIETTKISRLVSGCLILTTSGVAFFDFFYTLWSLVQEKQHVYNLSFAHFFLLFWSAILPFAKVIRLLLQKSSTKLGSTFESTAEPNYLSRIKLILGSAHVKFDVWTWPYLHLCKYIPRPVRFNSSWCACASWVRMCYKMEGVISWSREKRAVNLNKLSGHLIC